MRLLLLLICVFLPNLTMARAQANCDAIVEQAAQKFDVPAGLMSAMSRVLLEQSDTRQMVQTTPWAIKQGAHVLTFETAADMEAELENLILNGDEDLNLGCMQLNLIWHGDHFHSLQDMMHPTKSADYAAKVLSELYKEHGSWQKTIRAFHGPATDTQEYVNSVLRLYDTRKSVPSYLTQGDLLSVTAKPNRKRQIQSNLTFADSYAPHIFPKGRLN